ncbi:MAG: sugar phosphate isomerase/epimerase [Clostridia bacterium]|nr:sugar phosphate isomerase/epimerase [Clostridia bacterium]
MINKLGLQMWTLRDTMDTPENVRMTFRRMKELGYDIAQTAGCRIPYEDYARIAKEEGIEICGTHDDFDLMVNDIEKSIELHKILGTTNMGIGGFPCRTVEETEDFIEKANKIAARIAKEGMKFTYHNHSNEFIRLPNGKIPMDMLLEGLDPENTSFVLDTYWVQHGGADIRYWMEKLAGRIDILHLKDMAKCGDPDEQFITEIGNGNLYWEGILDVAEKIGVKYYVVEQDIWPGDPFDSIKISSEYLHKNFMK